MTETPEQIIAEMEKAANDQHFYPIPQRVDLIDLQAWVAALKRRNEALLGVVYHLERDFPLDPAFQAARIREIVEGKE